MRIEQDLKLGFKDVLIRPKRSTLKSRAEVKLERHYTFLHSKRSWTGIPIIAANMDTVGTFAMAEALAARGLLCAVHKHYALQSWQNWLQRQKATLYQHIMVSTGTAETDMEKLRAYCGGPRPSVHLYRCRQRLCRSLCHLCQPGARGLPANDNYRGQCCHRRNG